MKLKELKRTVNVCWSPAEHYPLTIAAGSAAQQVDASFSSSSYLELYSLNLDDPGSDFELKSSLQTQHKFQKIVWSGSEIIVGGCDGGLLQFYNSEKLLNNATDSLLGSCTKHNGNVSSLDINPYQKNLLASGASESEIFIWDLNNTSQPMAPGNRSQPYDHVQGLAWNQQVQHILGSTFATRCVVWDLRKNEPIMKLSDSQSRSRWRALAWHPGVATQLCIASEEDQVPVVQLWDLRLAASPLVTLEGHNKGVMAISWCKQDPDLLLSAGKDGRVLCWNPNDTKPGGVLLTEVSQQPQWVFDVAWSPRDPALLLASSLDHRVHLHSLLGGSKPETSTQSQSNIMDSFGGLDSFSQLPAVTRADPPRAPDSAQLPGPPRWLKRPLSAKFSFGGKLVTFERCPQEAGSQKQVYVSQVVSEPDLVQAAAELDAALGVATAPEALAEYCRSRGDAAADQAERFTWFFLRANFLPDFRTEVLNLLGFKQDEIPSKFKSPIAADASAQPDPVGLSRGESTETEAELSTDTSTDLSEAQTLIERKLANLDISPNVSNVVIPNGEDTTSLICRALVCGNLEEAVELCLDDKRVADAMLIASLGSSELQYRVQRWHVGARGADPVALLGGALLDARWERLVTSAAAASWRHTLAALLTHTDGEARAHYCEMLGDKLAQEGEASVSEAATTCYLVAMAPDAVVARWARWRRADVTGLAKLAALALLARRAALHRGRQEGAGAGGAVEAVLREYAGRLAAQGCLHSALATVAGAGAGAGATGCELKERLEHALGMTQQQNRGPQTQPQPGRGRTLSSHSAHKPQFGAHNNLNAYNQEPRYDQTWMNASTPAQHWTQPPTQPPTLPPTQPARPPSAGPQGGITSRSKYKVDPSVQPSNHYNQYSFNNNPITSQPQSYGYNSPIPDQYQNSSVPNTFAPINNPGLNPLNPPQNPLNTINPLNPINPALNPANPSLNPTNPVMNPLNPVMNPLNPGITPLHPGLNPMIPGPALNGNYYSPQQGAEAAMQPTQPQPRPAPAPAGWNDPPMMSSKPKPKQEVQSQAPITHPLFGVEPPQHVPLAPTPGQYPGQQYPGQQYPGQQYPGQYDQQYTHQYPQQYDQGMHQGYQHQTESAPPAEAAPVATVAPVQKDPIPEQHAVLQAVFDSLRIQCAEKALNPQMKRKLEDVQKRLETLYDLLREHKLSESALETLHLVAGQAGAGDAGAALGTSAALARGADFAAAAAFLPALRVLLQLAQQLQVRVG